LNARSLYHQYNENFDDAISYAKSALGLHPDNVNSLRVLGDAYLSKSHSSKFEELDDTEPRLFTLNDDLETSIKYFETILEQNDEDFTSVSRLLLIYGSSDIPLTAAARNAALVYEEVHDKGLNVLNTLFLANVYLKSGKIKSACEYFEVAKNESETSNDYKDTPLLNHVQLLNPSFEEQCEI
jgi:tetratricopeptide (TPR) repeat protein